MHDPKPKHRTRNPNPKYIKGETPPPLTIYKILQIVIVKLARLLCMLPPPPTPQQQQQQQQQHQQQATIKQQSATTSKNLPKGWPKPYEFGPNTGAQSHSHTHLAITIGAAFKHKL